MNYRHAYHTGNFADVLKHAIFVRVIEYMKRKDTPLRIIDTHGGRGRYALDRGEASRTGEWTKGIARLIGPQAVELAEPARALLAPYLDLVAKENQANALTVYPGSPRLAQGLLRRGDVLVANELHPEDMRALAALLDDDRQCKVMGLDAWSFLKAMLPPKERRGLVLIDPPFEEPGEFIRMTEGLRAAIERFATGTFLLWYPIKDPKPVARFHRALSEMGVPKILRAEVVVRPPRDPNLFNGCGLIVVNPPFTLEAELAILLPELARIFADTATVREPLYRLDWIEPAT
jgi:23S rRNA (adenine2030-N6)-methyltransferase